MFTSAWKFGNLERKHFISQSEMPRCLGEMKVKEMESQFILLTLLIHLV